MIHLLATHTKRTFQQRGKYSAVSYFSYWLNLSRWGKKCLKKYDKVKLGPGSREVPFPARSEQAAGDSEEKGRKVLGKRRPIVTGLLALTITDFS